MLNHRLPGSELEHSIKEYTNSVDYILNQITDTAKSVIYDKHLMGRLHHALNISNYAKSRFRENLLKSADALDLKQFLVKVGLAESNISNDKMMELIPKAASFVWEDNEQTRAFVDIFGYDKTIIPKHTTKLEKITLVAAPRAPLKTLKEYQSEIFFKGASMIENPWKRFIIRMPTGAGKTRTALEIVAHFLNAGLEVGERRQVVWLADREELCIQAIDTMSEIWPHIGKSDLTVYRAWGGARIDQFNNFSFIVITYQTLNNMLKSDRVLPTPYLIVSDEAHNVLAPTHKKVLKHLESNGTRIIGLTATPVRGVRTDENNRLQDYFNRVLLEINSGDTNSIEFLQNQGYLSYHRPIDVNTNIRFDMTAEESRKFEAERDLPKGMLDRIAENNNRNVIIAKILKKLNEENAQVLYFAPNVKQSKFMCALLLALGAKAAHIDKDSPAGYRRDVVEKFKNNEINFVFNYNIFSTGFDAPNIDVVFIARPTTSIVLHQQMIGRGMRGPKMGGTKTFRLYRVRDDFPTIDLADEYFSEIWKKGREAE